MMSADFGAENLCISKMGSTLDCFDFGGQKLWSYDSGPSRHIVYLFFSLARSRYFGIRLDYGVHENRKTLISFEPTSGKHEELLTFDSSDDVFVPHLDLLLTSQGTICRLSDGSAVGTLAFP
jgi:hypothetical protein